MDYENIKIEPINNGFKASVEIPKEILDLELNEYINKVDEINRLIINDKNELYIRALVNRISEAIEYIKENKDDVFWNEFRLDELLEILKGSGK